MNTLEVLDKEVSKKDILNIAQSPSNQKRVELYDYINNTYFGGIAPFKRIYLDKFDTESMANLDQILRSNKHAATILLNIGADIVGIGRGEIMFTYLIENCGVGGSAVDIDLTLYNCKGAVLDQVECKAVSMSKEGYLYGWRTGAKHRSIIENAKKDLKDLYNGLKDLLPELDTQTELGMEIADKVARDEGAQFINLIRDMDPVVINRPVLFTMEQDQEGNISVLKNGSDNIGLISSTSTIDTIKKLLTSRNTVTLKSFKEIETELANGFAAIEEKFVFIQTIGTNKKYGGIYYKDQLRSSDNNILIHAWTGGSIQVKVKS